MSEQNKTISSNEKLWAALGYIWVLSLVVLLLKKEKFVHGHAKQGFLIFVGECLLFVPVVGWIFGFPLSLISFVLAVVGFIKAYSGEEWKIPFIGEWWDEKIKI